LAFAFGLVAVRLGLPALSGYLLAGIAVGPFTPGFVADVNLAPQLAEIGVILLMFGVGTHFSIRDLWSVRGVALPGAIAQMAAATAMGAGLAHLWGWPMAEGLVFGLSLSVASTVVLLRALEARNLLDTTDGRIAVGWLVVEDIAMVLAIVLLPALAGVFSAHPAGGVAGPATLPEIATTAALTLGKVALFVVAMLVAGVRLIPWLVRQVERAETPEVFTLAAVALAIGLAFGSAKLFGVSYAFGAFIAGVVMSESDFSHRAARELRPLQDAFGALFFVAVGMLFDPRSIAERPLEVAAVVLVIVVGKSLAAAGIVLALRRPLSTALSVSTALAQIGEFSFILGTLAAAYGLLRPEAFNLIVAGALISITLNPLLMRLLPAPAPGAIRP
jgi:CPA2 family monovalent cation:H+ antiporter-2